MKLMLSTLTYTSRRSRLKKDIGSGLVLLPGNPLLPFNYAANTFPFRQDSSFLYFAGLDLPGFTVIIDIDNDREILFGHDPDMDDVIWEGPLPSLADLAASVGIHQAQPSAQTGAYLQKALAEGRTIHYLKPYHADLQLQLAEFRAGDAHQGRAGTHDLVLLNQQLNYQASYRRADHLFRLWRNNHLRRKARRYRVGLALQSCGLNAQCLNLAGGDGKFGRSIGCLDGSRKCTCYGYGAGAPPET